jgi:hypothetical protein
MSLIIPNSKKTDIEESIELSSDNQEVNAT